MNEGDVITISPCLEELETARKSFPFGVNKSMLNLCGRKAKITKVRTDSYYLSDYPDYPNLDGNRYYIDLDDGLWSWANIMFKEGVGLRIIEEDL